MLNKTVTKGLLSLMMAGAGLLGLAGQSQAAVFVGSFDPAFGGMVYPLANLGFRGQATFYVPDACLTSGDGFYVNGFGCTAIDKIKMISATVELYDATQPPVQSTIDTLAFPQFIFPDFSSINDVLIVGGAVVGVDTDIMMSPVDANVPDIYVGPIGLSFFQPCVFGETNYCFNNEGITSIGGGGADPAHIWVCDPLVLTNCSLIQSDPAIVTFVRVPEPASITLVVAALGAGLAARRRRRLAA